MWARPIRLTYEQAQEVRLIHAVSNWTQGDIAKWYGVSITTINNVVRMKGWHPLADAAEAQYNSDYWKAYVENKVNHIKT